MYYVVVVGKVPISVFNLTYLFRPGIHNPAQAVYLHGQDARPQNQKIAA